MTREPAVPGYDVERVLMLARTADPGLPEQTGRELVVIAEEQLADMLATGDEPDAPELARRLLAALPQVGATPAAVVARAAVDHLRGASRD